MTGSRFTVLALALFMTAVPASHGQSPTPSNSGCVNKIYSLAEFGGDAEFAKWIATTIPMTIMPNSWASAKPGLTGDDGRLSYYAPGKVLVVYHTPAAHAQIETFLKNVKKAMHTENVSAMITPPSVVQAQLVPNGATPYAPPPQMPPALTPTHGYPVPATATLPKHLFHFIIRYEGEGIIDSNVVKFAQALQEKVTGSSSCPVPAYSNVPVPPTSAFQQYSVPATLSNTNGPRMPTADGPPAPTPLPPTGAPATSTSAPTNAPPPPPPPGPTSVLPPGTSGGVVYVR